MEYRLPAALGDLDDSHKDDIVCRDPTLADKPIGRRAPLPCTILLRSQPHEQVPGDSDGELTCRNLQTARAMRAANDSMEIVLCAGVWSRVMI